MNEELMKNGAFGWFELMTTDVEGAKAFYKKLFGWEYETVPMPGSSYTVVKVDGNAVAGIMEMPEECRGMNPGWDIYVTVDDVDALAEEVAKQGGSMLKPVTEIPNVGRFCVLQDPQGAVLCAMTYAGN
jgi:uncharacterized protein